jgi:chromosome partitioning protein
MIVTVAGFKGGVGKSTTAIHLAAYLVDFGPTVLVDGDPNRSATGWSKRGNGHHFKVVDERAIAKAAREHEHVVVDTPARPSREDLDALADGCDLIVLPTLPNLFDLDALMGIVESLQAIGSEKFRALLTVVPPKPSRDGDEARAALAEAGLPMFTGSIRRAAAFTKAAVAGCVVCDVKDAKAFDCWADYAAVGREILS